MTDGQENPCLKGLTGDCFKAQPAWAKQAFAYRLVHLLCPRVLSKRLPKGLRQALVPPGVTLPPGADLPPGTIIPPGGDVPTTWNTGDPLPSGAIGAPTTPPGTDTTGTTPPTYVAPWTPGPVRTTPYTSPSGITYWLYDTFDVLDPTIWTDASAGAGSIAIDAGRLKMLSPGVGDVAGVRWLTAEPTQPDTFELGFDLNHVAGVGQILCSIRTGTHWLFLSWDPPNQLSFLKAGGGSTSTAIANMTGTTDTWRILWNGSTMTVYRDGTTIFNAVAILASAGNKGWRFFTQSDGDTTYLDNYYIYEI